MKTWKKELDLLKGAIAKRTEEALEEALNNTSELPGNGKHLPLVKDASALLVRIQEEKRVVAFLSKAIEKHDKSLLVQAIESAEKMDFAPPELGAAREALSKIKQEEALIAALKDCVAARDRSALDAKLGECADFGIPDDNEVVEPRRRDDLRAQAVHEPGRGHGRHHPRLHQRHHGRHGRRRLGRGRPPRPAPRPRAPRAPARPPRGPPLPRAPPGRLSSGKLRDRLATLRDASAYRFLRRFFFGAGAPASPPAARSALFVARVGAALAGSSGHGCFG